MGFIFNKMKGQIIFQDIEKWKFQIYLITSFDYFLFWGLGGGDLHTSSMKDLTFPYPYFILLKADIKPNDKIRFIKHKLNIYLLINIDLTAVRRLCFVVVVEMTCIRECIVFSLLMSVTGVQGTGIGMLHLLHLYNVMILI